MEDTVKSIFGIKNNSKAQPHQGKLEHSPSGVRKWIKELSPLANIVVAKCARILLLGLEDLKQHFEEEAAPSAKFPAKYARNFLEYCCFRALSVATQTSDHLGDKEFRRLTFDMMLAWEAPGAANKPAVKTDEDQGGTANDEDEDSALFYSDLMPMLVDVESTVGPEAFCRLAPAIPVVADVISVHCQFDAFTATTGGRLPYPIYDKYVAELDKVIKNMKNLATPSLVSNLRFAKGEMIIDVDGTVTTQPVLQHAGVSTWPGRLTLTDRALYFEPTGVVSYDKPKKFDFCADLHHSVKPDLTGPWGARLFDKAITIKSDALSEPVVLEFPELTGHSRRDYWLAVVREIIMVHQFVRNFHLEDFGRSEARARAVLGCARLRATKEACHSLPKNPEALLTFSLSEELPGGDMVLQALAERLRIAGEAEGGGSSDVKKSSRVFANPALAEMSALGTPIIKEPGIPVGEILIGDFTPLEKAVQQARSSSRKVEIAQTTIEGVRVEGIGTNVAIMKELVVPFVDFVNWLQDVASWREPFKAAMFCVMFSYIIYRDWVAYVPPILLVLAILHVYWLRYSTKGKRDLEVVVRPPPGQSTLEQLMALQQAISQVEGIIQAANIFLLKLRALMLSAQPEATDLVLVLLGGLAVALAVLPLRVIALVVFLDIFTRQMHVRRESSERFNRRLREWWYAIPAVPVRVEGPDEQHQQ